MIHVSDRVVGSTTRVCSRPTIATSNAVVSRGCRGPSVQLQHYRRSDVKRTLVVTCSKDDEKLHESKLGPNVLAGVKELKENIKWTPATVIRNDAVSLDGSLRLLHLSVEDHVDVLYGRRVKGVVDSAKWIDSYTMPGQFVGLRIPGPAGEATPAKRLYSIASTPYQSRRDSAYIGASIIEIVVEKDGIEDDSVLAELGPGSVLEVTQVIGRGFSSLFNSYIALPTALEEKKDLVMIGVGARGVIPLRAVLSWTPILAHATAHKVTCFYVTSSPSHAGFLTEWDSWREAGITFSPIYTVNSEDPSEGGVDLGSSDELLTLLEWPVFHGEHGFGGATGSKPDNTIVLLAGFTGDAASKISKQLNKKGISHENILFCDFF